MSTCLSLPDWRGQTTPGQSKEDHSDKICKSWVVSSRFPLISLTWTWTDFRKQKIGKEWRNRINYNICFAFRLCFILSVKSVSRWAVDETEETGVWVSGQIQRLNLTGNAWKGMNIFFSILPCQRTLALIPRRAIWRIITSQTQGRPYRNVPSTSNDYISTLTSRKWNEWKLELNRNTPHR